MRDHGGVILNVVSVGGIRPGPSIGAYNVSKAALAHLTRQLALELAPGVRVNAVAPALVKTDMARALWEPNEEAMARMHPLGRLGVPDDIAAAALFLVSDASSWMTGEVIVVDGGAAVSNGRMLALTRRGSRASILGLTATCSVTSGRERALRTCARVDLGDAVAVALGELGVGARG